ncbi:hypothetical protein OKA06_20300 [Novosphingobium sp. MW5]|nr:hypothetical protein [Novosphingobium sp. MW5]
MILEALFLYLFAGVTVASAFMVIASRNPGGVGSVPDPGLRELRRPVHSPGGGIPGTDLWDRGLCRRGGGAVPVRQP